AAQQLEDGLECVEALKATRRKDNFNAQLGEYIKGAVSKIKIPQPDDQPSAADSEQDNSTQQVILKLMPFLFNELCFQLTNTSREDKARKANFIALLTQYSEVLDTSGQQHSLSLFKALAQLLKLTDQRWMALQLEGWAGAKERSEDQEQLVDQPQDYLAWQYLVNIQSYQVKQKEGQGEERKVEHLEGQAEDQVAVLEANTDIVAKLFLAIQGYIKSHADFFRPRSLQLVYEMILQEISPLMPDNEVDALAGDEAGDGAEGEDKVETQKNTAKLEFMQVLRSNLETYDPTHASFQPPQSEPIKRFDQKIKQTINEKQTVFTHSNLVKVIGAAIACILLLPIGIVVLARSWYKGRHLFATNSENFCRQHAKEVRDTLKSAPMPLVPSARG
ncbi:MAG: hypothetical protein K0U12_06435, partial [Gammaproteobacteria bacterium]|nr:hypothetical protein [Gammaproteobacteria bacterium]